MPINSPRQRLTAMTKYRRMAVTIRSKALRSYRGNLRIATKFTKEFKRDLNTLNRMATLIEYGHISAAATIFDDLWRNRPWVAMDLPVKVEEFLSLRVIL